VLIAEHCDDGESDILTMDNLVAITRAYLQGRALGGLFQEEDKEGVELTTIQGDRGWSKSTGAEPEAAHAERDARAEVAEWAEARCGPTHEDAGRPPQLSGSFCSGTAQPQASTGSEQPPELPPGVPWPLWRRAWKPISSIPPAQTPTSYA
jgi:hypothetical protein